MHSKFTDIGQFRNVIKSITNQNTFIGLDKNEEPIYNKYATPPVITFKGTVKLHGTNAGVAINKDGDVWYQSRTNIITPEKDNAGFAFFAESHKEIFKKYVLDIREKNNIVNDTIIIFGEWCGKGIQKGVAINELDKMFVIFSVKVVSDDADSNYYLTEDKWCNYEDTKHKIYNINNFKTFTLDIDFNDLGNAQNKLIEITEEVEKECPVAKSFGVSGIGEGVVWVGYFKDKKHTFKVKGGKHSVSKVKKLAPIDTEKLNSIKAFVDYAVTENRLNQGIEQVFTCNNKEPDIKNTGDFIRWIVNDIIKEELDTLNDNSLEPKDVNRDISFKARIWFMNYIEK